ncbi:uncharacterized protein G2W53_016870 [Senna tora]|uniref:Uncharacterized protein n=1 Tax=Senna tora TaxID=362788 RepID=A0A834TRQ9_9FABA|nr:uncharacterized protein G2W53_016870 [Senna tora]
MAKNKATEAKTQILQWLFKGAHEQEREINISPEATKKKANKDQNAQGNKNIILVKHPRAHRRRTSNIEEGSKHGHSKNVNIFAFICTKDIAKSCFYSTIKLKRVGSFNSRENFVYSMKMKRDEIARGIVGNTNKADSAAHVGKKVLPVSEERNEQCGISGSRDQIKGDKKKPISRMKELLRWAATAKTEKGGKVNGRKALKFRRDQGTLKTVRDDEEAASIDSPKISFRWEVESCSTTSSVYSAVSVASTSKNGQTQVLPSLISIPHAEPDHNIDCRRRKGNWITTDSEFPGIIGEQGWSVLQFNVPSSHIILQRSAPESDKKMAFMKGKKLSYNHLMKGEPLVRKLAVLSGYVVLPAAMIAALVYSPPDYSSSSKKHTSAATK